MLIRSTLATAALLASLATTVCAQSVPFTLQAGPHARERAVVTVDLPEGLRGKALKLQVTGGAEIAVQAVDAQRAQFVLEAPLKANESRKYTLSIAASAISVTPAVKEDTTDGKLTFEAAQGDRKQPKLLTYNIEAPPVPPLPDSVLRRENAKPDDYLRSGHIHPVYTPSGKVVTDGYPVDIHTHQHGVFHAWTRTTFQGHMVDFWNQHQREGKGTIEHRELINHTPGPVFGSLTSKLAYLDLSQGARTDALHEQWTVRAYNHPQGTLFEIETKQTAVGDTPIMLDKYTYGGMAIRGAAGWYAQARSKECNALTSEGKDRTSGNNTTPNWCDLFGKVDGEVIGIAMFSHPTNPASPQPVRIHNDLPYFVYSPIINGEISITKDKPYTARYLIFAHDGAPNPDVLNALWNNYAHPPRVEWN